MRGDLIKVYNFRKGSRGADTDLLFLVTIQRTQGNGMKLHQTKSRLGIRRKFTGRVVSHWNRLLRKMVAALSLSEYVWTMLSVIWFSFRKYCEK